MAEEPENTRSSTPIQIIQRAVRRPYLFMAAVVLIIGAIWFFRLAVQEFLLIDRLVNVYTNVAQVQMDAYAVRPAVTAEVLEVLVSEGQNVQKGQILIRLAQQDILTELHQAEAAAEEINQRLQEMRATTPLTIERAQNQMQQAKALVNTKEQVYRRAQVLLTVQKDRTDKMLSEHDANINTAKARLREQETAMREADMTLSRMTTLHQDGIVSQDRLDAAKILSDRSQARLVASRAQVQQVKVQYPSGDSPQMIRVHAQDVKRLASELKQQQAALEVTRTNLRLSALGTQKIKVLEAQYKATLANVEAFSLKLDKTIIRSPSNGIIAYRNVDPGEMVEGDPSNSPIIVIHNPRNPWIAANVWESDINRVHLGNEAEIWIDAFKNSALGRGKPLMGKVFRINPTTLSEVAGLPPERFFTRRERKIPVGISIEGEGVDLRAGMLAEVLIHPNSSVEAREQ